MKISRGKIPSAVRCTIFGSEGIGKSTLASQFPEPLFVDIEDGTKQLDVARTGCDSWHELQDIIREVGSDPTICRTLVIDTIDRAEMLLTAQLLEEGRCDSIEKYGGGYGKGYTALAERFQKDFLWELDKLIAKGINVCLIAHAAMRKFESPEDPPYDRWELKVSKKVAPIVKEWSDLLLFCNYQTVVVDENGKGKARGSGKRMMHANHKPTYDAKNRFGLPDDMPLSFEPLEGIFTAERVVEKTVLDINNPQQGIVEDDMNEDIFTVFRRHLEEAGLNERGLLQWMVRTKRGVFKSIDDMSIPYVKNLDEHIELLKEQIEGGKE